MLKYVCAFIGCWLTLSTSSFAQSRPAAEGLGRTLSAGAEISTFNPDYGCEDSSAFKCGDKQLLGIGIFADADHLLLNRVGAEGEVRFLNWRGPDFGLTQSNYLIGPRVRLIRYRPILLSAKFLIGDARFTISHDPTENYLAYVPGATAELRLTKRVSARLDYEYQDWPSFGEAYGGGGLSPNGFSFGASYAFIR